MGKLDYSNVCIALQYRCQALSQFFNRRVIGPQHVSHARLHSASRISHSFVEAVWEAAAFERGQSFVAFHSYRMNICGQQSFSGRLDILFLSRWQSRSFSSPEHQRTPHATEMIRFTF
jgi:hypothetical protein